MFLVFLIRCQRQQRFSRDRSAAGSASLFNNAESVNALPLHFATDLQSDILRNLISLYYKTSVLLKEACGKKTQTYERIAGMHLQGSFLCAQSHLSGLVIFKAMDFNWRVTTEK